MKNINIVLIIAVVCLIAVSVLIYRGLFMPEKEVVEDTSIFIPEEKPIIKPITAAVPSVKEAKIAEVPLDLVLVATIIDETEGSLAVIRDKLTKYEAGYHIGDRIRDATLSHIQLSKVTLRRKSGKEETLKITSKQVNIFISISDIIVPQEDKKIVHKKLLVSKYKSLNNILKEVSLRPAISRGKIEGIRINNLKKGIIKQAGFEKGDVIKKVNNRSITNPKDAIGIYRMITRQMKTDSSFPVKVTLERDGKTETITYDVVD